MNMMSSTDKSLPRNMTAVGTMGEMGQLFTVYEKNWNCKDCGQENYSSRYVLEFHYFYHMFIPIYVIIYILLYLPNIFHMTISYDRPRCFRCKKQKPLGEKNYVLDPAVEAAKSGKVISWQEVVDPATYQM